MLTKNYTKWQSVISMIRVRAVCPSLSVFAHLSPFSYFCSKADHRNPHNCPSQKLQISLYTFFNPKLNQSLPCNYFANLSTSYQPRTGLDHFSLGLFQQMLSQTPSLLSGSLPVASPRHRDVLPTL